MIDPYHREISSLTKGSLKCFKHHHTVVTNQVLYSIIKKIIIIIIKQSEKKSNDRLTKAWNVHIVFSLSVHKIKWLMDINYWVMHVRLYNKCLFVQITIKVYCKHDISSFICEQKHTIMESNLVLQSLFRPLAVLEFLWGLLKTFKGAVSDF